MGCMSSRNAEERTEKGANEQDCSFDVSSLHHGGPITRPRPHIARPRQSIPGPSGRSRSTSNAGAELSHSYLPRIVDEEHSDLHYAVGKRRNDREEGYRSNSTPKEQVRQDLEVRRKIYEEEERYQGNTVNTVIRRKIMEYGVTSRLSQRQRHYSPHLDKEDLTAHSYEHRRPTGPSRPNTSAPLLTSRRVVDEGPYETNAEGSVTELGGYDPVEAVGRAV
ncbi:MAG: hypothetical protein M1839_003944 [Geoglossum umbratile]|nr:MAG: hypothetical protein M1839_003944 [Geoglossum umbratile]